MGEVHCLYKWDEKKAQQLMSWVKADEQRYVLFLDEKATLFNLPHPRMRQIAVSTEVLEKIAWEFLYLPFSFDAPDHPLLKQVASIVAEVGFRAFDFADQGIQIVKNLRSHLLQPTSYAKDLYGKFQGTTALICGGGPSIATVSSELKRLQDTALIIGCGAGVEALLKMGIKPHFAAHVDPNPLHRFTAQDTPLFYQLRTSSKVAEKYKGKHLLVSGAGNLPLESWIQTQRGLEPVFDGGWTVGTFGVALAVALGCDRIILAGIDLATVRDLYAPGVKTSSNTEHFLPMKNQKGEDVLSRSDWILAARWLQQFASTRPDLKWGTISKRGLEIPSIPTVELHQIATEGGLSARIQTMLQNLPLYEGEPLWNTVRESLQRSLILCGQLLQEIEAIFPNNPAENGKCALLEHDLSQEIAFEQILDPLWSYWVHPFRRLNQDGEKGLYLNRILFFTTTCENLYAL